MKKNVISWTERGSVHRGVQSDKAFTKSEKGIALIILITKNYAKSRDNIIKHLMMMDSNFLCYYAYAAHVSRRKTLPHLPR
jgi:hypothetical protein